MIPQKYEVDAFDLQRIVVTTELELGIETRMSQGHKHWQAGNIDTAYEIWHEATMERWAFCKQEGYDIFGTRFLSERWVENIGHFFYLDAYLKLFRLGLLDAKHICLALDKDARISNTALLELFKEHLTVMIADENPFSDTLKKLRFWLREDLDYIRIDDSRGIRLPDIAMLANKKWSEAGLPSLLQTNPEMNSVGQTFLEQHGITANDWYVCLHVRAPGYNAASRRDSKIADYKQIIRHLINLGAKVIRMGDSSMPPAPVIEGLIDYALMPDKDPRIDIFLSTHCRFFVGCVSGLMYVPMMFSIPCIIVNWAPIGLRPISPDIYYLPKIYRCTNTQRILSIQEVLERGIGNVESLEVLQNQHTEIIDNSPEEITEAVSFFFDHVVLGQPLSLKDVQLQVAYAAAFDQAGVEGSGMVDPNFAKKNREIWSFTAQHTDSNRGLTTMKSLVFNIDYNYQPINIGDFILNLLVCSALFKSNNLDYIDVNIINDPESKHADPQLSSLSHANKQRKIFDIIQLLQLLPNIKNIRFFKNTSEFLEDLKHTSNNKQVHWPSLDKLSNHDYIFYDSVQLVSNYILKTQTYPLLNFSEYQNNYALQFYRKHAYPCVPVTVNLRNNTYFHSHRNSLIEEWKIFFAMAVDKYPVKFVIVSSFGEIDPEIANMKNVVYAKQHCTSLVDDLSLLFHSAFHLGNASGPSLINYYTEKPYYIFNCDMKPHVNRYFGALIEESDSLRYAFATPYQNFGVVPETSDDIGRQFERIWNSRDWLEWAFVDFYRRRLLEIPYWF